VSYDPKRPFRNDSRPVEAVRVGDELREARLALGISLEAMAEQLRINRRYLVALEEGRVGDLPGTAYGIGFVRSYAQAMGLDAPALVRRFREGMAGQERGKDLIFPEPVPERGVPAGAIVLLGVVLAIGAYAAWYRWSGPAERTVDAVPPLPPHLDQAAREAGQLPLPEPPRTTAPGPSAAPPAMAPRPATSEPPPAGGGAPQTGPAAPQGAAPAVPAAPVPPPIVPPAAEQAPAPAPAANTIVLRAMQECWIQVREARTGRVLFSRLLRPGETYEVPHEPDLLLTMGRAEALTIEVDGVPSRVLADQVGVRRDILLDAGQLREAQPGQLPTR